MNKESIDIQDKDLQRYDMNFLLQSMLEYDIGSFAFQALHFKFILSRIFIYINIYFILSILSIIRNYALAKVLA